MNHRLVESLAQIVLSLSEEERQLLQSKLQAASTPPLVADLASRIKRFEEKYQMRSEHFYQRFQTGDLGDAMDFFEWNTYYEMLNAAQVKAAEN